MDILSGFKKIKITKEKILLIFLVGVLIAVIKLPVSGSQSKKANDIYKSGNISLNNREEETGGNSSLALDIQPQRAELYDFYSYACYMEKKINEVLEFTYGEDFCDVVINVTESGIDLASKRDTDSVTESTYPVVSGVLIGVKNVDEKTKAEISYAVDTLLHVGVNNIKVISRR